MESATSTSSSNRAEEEKEKVVEGSTSVSFCIHHPDGEIVCHPFHVDALDRDTDQSFYDKVKEDVRRSYTKQVCNFYETHPTANPTYNSDGTCSLTFNSVRVKLHDIGDWDVEQTFQE